MLKDKENSSSNEKEKRTTKRNKILSLQSVKKRTISWRIERN
jgi:hypothetical protein